MKHLSHSAARSSVVTGSELKHILVTHAQMTKPAAKNPTY